MKSTEIKTATTKQLVKFYNSHLPVGKKAIKKFATRAVAERRLHELVNMLKATDRGDAIKRSWLDPVTKVARSTRHHVYVDGESYRSVKQAFEELGLDLKGHIKFRMELKAVKSVKRYNKQWELFEV